MYYCEWEQVSLEMYLGTIRGHFRTPYLIWDYVQASEISLVVSAEKKCCSLMYQQEDLLPWSPVGMWRRLDWMHQEPGCLPGGHQTAFQPAGHKRLVYLVMHGAVMQFNQLLTSKLPTVSSSPIAEEAKIAVYHLMKYITRLLRRLHC